MDFKKTMQNFKKGHNIHLIIILLVGAFLMVFPFGGEKKSSDNEKFVELSVDYKRELEEILSRINGVGDVNVMVTYSSSFEKNIAYEKNSNKNEKKDGDNKIINETSSNTNVVLSSGEPFVVKQIYPEIKGVVVVADGAEDIFVKQNITDAVTTALGIAPHKVCVVKKSEK